MAKYSGLERDKNERSLDYSSNTFLRWDGKIFQTQHGENITTPELNMIQKYIQEHYYKLLDMFNFWNAITEIEINSSNYTKEEKQFWSEIDKFHQEVRTDIFKEYWMTDGKIKKARWKGYQNEKSIIFYMRYPTWVRADNEVRLTPGQGKLRVLPFPKKYYGDVNPDTIPKFSLEKLLMDFDAGLSEITSVEGLLNEYRKSVEVRKRRRKENKMKKELATQQLEKQRQKQEEGDRRDMERKKREDAIRMSRKS